MSGPDAWLTTSLQFLKGVGPRKAADFARAGLHTVEDLLYRFPLRYEDRSRLQPIASLREGQTVSILGDVITCGLRGTRRPGLRIFEALLRDRRVKYRDIEAAFKDDPDLPTLDYSAIRRHGNGEGSALTGACCGRSLEAAQRAMCSGTSW